MLKCFLPINSTCLLVHPVPMYIGVLSSGTPLLLPKTLGSSTSGVHDWRRGRVQPAEDGKPRPVFGGGQGPWVRQGAHPYPQSCQPHTGGLHSSRRSSWPQCRSPSPPRPSQSPAKRHRGSGDGAGGVLSLLQASPARRRRQRPLPGGMPRKPSLASPQEGRGRGPRVGAAADATHPSPFDGISQEPHDVVPFCS